MGLLEDFKGASLWAKLALIFLLVATLFVGIAFTCTGWGVDDVIASPSKTYYGLWRSCSDDNNVGVIACKILDGTANDWWAFTQAGSCFGFFGTLVSCLLIVLYTFVSKCQKNGEVAMAAGIIGIVTGIIFLIACIVFGVEWSDHHRDVYIAGVLTRNYSLGYAFALAVIAALLEVVAGVFCILEAKKGGGTGASG